MCVCLRRRRPACAVLIGMDSERRVSAAVAAGESGTDAMVLFMVGLRFRV